MINEIRIEDDVRRWINEDISFWDITTSLIPKSKAEAKIYSKQEGIIAGLHIAEKIFGVMGADFKPFVEEGEKVAKKTQIASIKGDIHALLQTERLALNILGRLSGIATQTAIMIEVAKETNPDIRICGTRKTVPGLSIYDKYAIAVGGGDTHRFNLSDMILLKENHLQKFKSITEAISVAKSKTSFSKKIEVEVQNEEQAIEAATAGVDIIMFDNFSPIQVKHTIARIKKLNLNVLIELSGNINLDNINLYSIEGVNLISSGALTHSVKNFDLTMLIE
jgi:nicotinate-nucleotide pyrophosphorylase (carboxylating)